MSIASAVFAVSFFVDLGMTGGLTVMHRDDSPMSTPRGVMNTVVDAKYDPPRPAQAWRRPGTTSAQRGRRADAPHGRPRWSSPKKRGRWRATSPSQRIVVSDC